MPSMQERIEEKLEKEFQPMYLKVVNESIHHRGHAGDDGSGESHFSVEMRAEMFSGKSRLTAQRMVYGAISEEMKFVHALTMKLSP